MKRLIIGGAAAALIAGGAGMSFAAGPGPNGHNNHGLCTAYFAGSDNGQAHKHQAGPFVALEEDAHQQEADNNGGQDDPNTDTAQEVANYCMPYLGGNGNGNGNNGNPNGGKKG